MSPDAANDVAEKPDAAGRREGGRYWLARWAAPTLLVLVALQQILWVYTDDLDPWKGGGFGMFSTIETRMLRVQVVRGEGPGLNVDLSTTDAAFELLKNRAITKPDEATMRTVARAILDADFVPTGLLRHQLFQEMGSTDETPAPGSWPSYRMRDEHESWLDDRQVVRFQKIRVQIWRFHFDPETARLHSESIGPLVELER